MTQEEALNILKTGANVFLTGEPGSGKTHTVNTYVSYLHSCGVEPSITASTGIASTHIGGMTIHSWCGLGVRSQLSPYDLDTIAGSRKVMERIGNARVLIIDEVSMLSATILAMTDAVCREVRKGLPRGEDPFGGLQVIFVGDFFQLPPIHHHDADASQRKFTPRAKPSTEFAFTASSWRKANPLVCYLSEQHRQEDEAFLEFLGAIRRGNVAERHKALLRTRYHKIPEAGVTELYSHNANVDHVNTLELSKLPGQPKAFVMTGHGGDSLVVSLKRGCLSPEVLSLKVGARVMFTKNDVSGRFVNGTTGFITEFSKDTPGSEGDLVRDAAGYPIVKTDSGQRILAEPLEWHIQDGGRILARITQIPLRLAWAITVHKSQGMSLDAAHMDLSSAFEYGQGYVALSRVRTLKGLSLAGLNARALEVHPEIKDKDRDFRAESEMVREKFRGLDTSELRQMHGNFIRAIGGKVGSGRASHRRKEKTDTLEVTKTLILEKRSLHSVAKERGVTLGTIVRHLEQLKEKGRIVPERDLMHLSPDPDRLALMEKAFRTLLSRISREGEGDLRDASGLIKLSPVRALLDDSFSFEELRLARLFLPAF